MTLQRAGAWAALAGVVYWVQGVAVRLGVLGPPSETRALVSAWFLILVAPTYFVLVAALHERLRTSERGIMYVATPMLFTGGALLATLGVFLFAAAPALGPQQPALLAVLASLGGGLNLLFGAGIVLVAWAALRAGWMPAWMNYVGILAGIERATSFLHASVLPPTSPISQASPILVLLYLAFIAWSWFSEAPAMEARPAPAMR